MSNIGGGDLGNPCGVDGYAALAVCTAGTKWRTDSNPNPSSSQESATRETRRPTFRINILGLEVLSQHSSYNLCSQF